MTKLERLPHRKGLLMVLLMSLCLTILFTFHVQGAAAASDVAVRIYNEATNALVEENLPVNLGENLRWKAVAVSGDNKENPVTSEASWTSSNPSVATVSNGTVTLVGQGKATIYASYNGSVGSVKLTVSSPYSSFKINPAGTIDLKFGEQPKSLMAVAKNTATQNLEDVTAKAAWRSSNESVATVKDGVVTVTGVGTAIISAEYLGERSQVNVIGRSAYLGLRLTPEADQVASLSDAPLHLKAEAMTDTNGTVPVTEKATWTSSNTAVAMVDNQGVVTPRSVGVAKITASYYGVKKEITYTVAPNLASMKLSAEQVQLFVGASAVLPKVTGVDTSGATGDVSKDAEWSSSNKDVADIANGKIVAKNKGTADLVVKVRNLTARVQVKVTPKVVSINANPKTITMVAGQEKGYPAIVAVYEDGTQETVTNLIQWKASNGKLIAGTNSVKGVTPSTSTLTGTFLNKKVAVRVVVEDEVIQLKAEPASIQLNLNKSQAIKVTGITRTGKKVSLANKMTWIASNTAVASVKGTSIKGLAEGSGILRGTYQDKMIEIPYTVKPKLLKLKVSPVKIALNKWQSSTFKVEAVYEGGKSYDVTTQSTWTLTSNSTGVSVDYGRVSGTAKGSASIKFTYGGKSANLRVVVSDK